MKKQVSFAVVVLGLMFALSGRPAQAQDTNKITLFGGYSYMINNSQQGAFFEDDELCFEISCGGNGISGYTGSITYNLSKHVGLEANFSGHNGNSTLFAEPATINEDGFAETERQDVYTYTFGPKFTLPVGHFSLFTHVLVGGVHQHTGFSAVCLQGAEAESCSEEDEDIFSGNGRGNGFAFKTGGGVDWNHGRWGVRILEVDYVHTSIFSTETIDGENESLQSHVSGNNFELATGITLNLK